MISRKIPSSRKILYLTQFYFEIHPNSEWVGLLGCVDGGLGGLGRAEVWGGWELDTLYHGGGGAGVLGCWGGGGV